MTFNQIIALVALALGLVNGGAYLAWWMGREPRLLSKLHPMQARWGRTTGAVVHFIAYVLAPLVIAALLGLSDA